MEPADFSRDIHGRLVHSPRGYLAFVPSPLPPLLASSWELTNALSAADRALSELAGMGRILPNPHLLIRPYLRREAVLSSRIEGTLASLSDLFFFEASEKTERQAPDVREVANYVRALEYGLKRLGELPLSLRLIREIHEQLMGDVRGGGMDRTPGEFRRSQNWIGPPGCVLANAIFVPPPIEEMDQALGDLEKYLHAPSDLPPLVRLALIHYQFEAIHPLLDGNGRIGRLLISLLLQTEALLPHPLLYLSAYFEHHRSEYYRRLLRVSQANEWSEWIVFFLRGIAEQAQDAEKRSGLLLGQWHAYRRELQSPRSSALLLRLVDELFSYPVITVASAAELLHITPTAAQSNINHLVAQGILREVTGWRRNRIYVASEIMHIITIDRIEPPTSS